MNLLVPLPVQRQPLPAPGSHLDERRVVGVWPNECRTSGSERQISGASASERWQVVGVWPNEMSH
jgi:hypothetical protein